MTIWDNKICPQCGDKYKVYLEHVCNPKMHPSCRCVVPAELSEGFKEAVKRAKRKRKHTSMFSGFYR